MIEEKAFIEKIHYLYDLKRYKQVIELCMKYLYVENEYIEYLYSKIIESNLELKLFDKAEKFVNEALKKFPNNSYYHALLTRVYLERMNYTKALKEVNIALSLSPNDAYLFYLKAVVFNDRYDFIDAERMIMKALEQDSSNISYMSLYARVLYNLGNKKYKEILDNILSIDPNNSDAIYFMSTIDNKSFKKQKKGFLKALKINPFSKTYQSALKTNKRDLILFFLSIFAIVVEIFLTFQVGVPSVVKNTLIIFIIISVIHLSYYSLEAYLLTAFAIFPFLIDEKKTSISLILISFFLSLFFAYFLRNIAKIFKTIIISLVETLQEAKNTIKYLTIKDLPELFKSNILKIILLILSVVAFLNQLSISTSMIFIIPFFVLIIKKQFSFSSLFKSFALLYLLKSILILIMPTINIYPPFSYWILALFMGIIYTETVRRII
jgi:tetratricopeptide (TPR) repeat protein